MASECFNASVKQPSDVDGTDRSTLTFVDLFAGCGGLALGFLQEGFAPVGGVEIDEDAAKTYMLNVDENMYAGRDIADDDLAWSAARVVIGGPPCQGFSQLGSRDSDDPRNQLWRHYVEVLDATGADVFVMENVPQLLKSPQFELFLGEVDRRHFVVDPQVLNAADFGVPQVRRRAIVIGSRLGIPERPVLTHGPKSPLAVPHVTVREAFAQPVQLPFEPTGEDWHAGRPGIRPQLHPSIQGGPFVRWKPVRDAGRAGSTRRRRSRAAVLERQAHRHD